MDALVIRVAALGDVVAAEPFVRALTRQRGFENIYVKADIYAEVFWNHPVAKLCPPPGPCETFDLTGVYEKYLSNQVQMTAAYLSHFGLRLPGSEMLPRLHLVDEEKAYAQWLLGEGDWVVMDMGYPGGPLDRGFWPFDAWMPVFQAVKDMGFKIVYVGGRTEFGLGPQVDLDIRRKTTLRQLFAVINHCKYFLGMDSGPMHVAEALGVKGLGIFNPRHSANCIIAPGSCIFPIHMGCHEPFRHDEVIQGFSKLEAGETVRSSYA
jgi:ADP-heptose:LPS heptosyltransferase